MQFDFHKGCAAALACGKLSAWEKQARALRVPRDPKIPGACTICGQKFPEPDMVKKFREHKCGEDVSQTAARIVKQATESEQN